MTVLLGSRERSQPAPPHVLWETLVDPRRATSRQWLALVDDEVEPAVLKADRPGTVVWSSLWPDRPHDRIRFDIRADGRGGSRLRWTLETDEGPPGDAVLVRMRYRINVVINGEMRDAFDQ